MTVNEIKIAALQLMFTNYANDIRELDIDALDDEEYTQYTVNMDACINRALGRFESAGVLPLGSVTFGENDGNIGVYMTRYDMSVIEDYAGISRVVYERYYDYNGNVDYALEGDTLILPTLSSGAEYRVLYHKRTKRIPLLCPSSTEIEIPNYLAELIPYFIKAELFEEDEPSIATQARNIFEAMLSERIKTYASGQARTRNIYEGLQ